MSGRARGSPGPGGGGSRRRAAHGALLGALLVASFPAPAAAQRAEGTVLRIDGNELLVDLGSRDGVVAGEPVRVYRRIVVEHPVSHRPIEDRFPIGEEQLAQVAERMSIVVLDTTFTHAPTVGDSVVLLRAEAPPPQEAPPEEEAAAAECPVCEAATCPEPPPCVVDRELADLVAAFGRTLGKPPQERIAVLEGYLAGHPASTWGPALRAEIQGFQALLRAGRGEQPAAGGVRSLRIGHVPPAETFLGEPVLIDLAVDPRAAFRLVQFHVRRAGENAYQTFDAVFDGDCYVRMRIPEEFVTPEGFEYFVVGVTGQGAERPFGGSPGSPIRVPVREREETPPVREMRSELNAKAEYVDFYATDLARDWYVRFETDFTYRLGFWFYDLRMGFGVLDGSGGPVSRIDREPDDPLYRDPQPISYRYGYTELEFRLHEIVYLIGRLSVGSARAYSLPDGRSEAPEALVGGLGKIRIGRPDGTNLVLGGGYIEDLGYEALVSVNLGILDDFPMRGHVIVTDMPVEEDLGVRLLAEFGWKATDWLEVDALLGYGIRTIHHAGFSAGLGTSFRW